MSGGYRAAVLDELYIHEERFTAPSFGIDAARVLAHAVHARRTELAWAVGVLLLWIVAGLVAGGALLLVVVPSMLIALAPSIRGRAARPPVLRRVAAFAARWYGRITLLVVFLALIGAAASAFTDDEETIDFAENAAGLPYGTGTDFAFQPDADPFSDGLAAARAWPTLLLFALIVLCVALRREQFARLMTGPLSRANFPDVASDPAELVQDLRATRLKAQVRYEQHAPLVMYPAENPFRGSGAAFRTWTLAVELRPRKESEPEPLDNRTILEHVRKLVRDLQTPSAHGSAEAAEAVRDRLRELQTDECVFLPAEGIPHRNGAPYRTEDFEEHRRAALEEGGEARRHFLRIRVGGWHEEVVVTVFVRVHTQGGMLMLEFAPHMLMPVDRGFREADRLAHRYLNNHLLGKIAWALAHTPQSLGQAVLTLGRHGLTAWEVLTGRHRSALPDGAALSVREEGADPSVSLFQEMDVLRYLKSIEDRVANGVKTALFDAGWQTAEFEQKVVNVSGGVYVDSARNSAFGFGDHSTVTTLNKTTTGGSNAKS